MIASYLLVDMVDLKIPTKTYFDVCIHWWLLYNSSTDYGLINVDKSSVGIRSQSDLNEDGSRLRGSDGSGVAAVCKFH